MAKSRVGKVVALVLVISVGVVFSAGCFGKFQLTRNLYDINRSVKDKYLRSAVTWLFVIPYGLAGFLVYERGGERTEMTIVREGGATVATIGMYRAGSLVSTLRVRDDGAGSVTSELRENGNVSRTMTATLAPDGSVTVAEVSASGEESIRYSPTAVAIYRARVDRLAGEAEAALAAAGATPVFSPARVPARSG
jgi:hypothetical protein